MKKSKLKDRIAVLEDELTLTDVIAEEHERKIAQLESNKDNTLAYLDALLARIQKLEQGARPARHGWWGVDPARPGSDTTITWTHSAPWAPRPCEEHHAQS